MENLFAVKIDIDRSIWSEQTLIDHFGVFIIREPN